MTRNFAQHQLQPLKPVKRNASGTPGHPRPNHKNVHVQEHTLPEYQCPNHKNAFVLQVHLTTKALRPVGRTLSPILTSNATSAAAFLTCRAQSLGNPQSKALHPLGRNLCPIPTSNAAI